MQPIKISETHAIYFNPDGPEQPGVWLIPIPDPREADPNCTPAIEEAYLIRHVQIPIPEEEHAAFAEELARAGYKPL